LHNGLKPNEEKQVTSIYYSKLSELGSKSADGFRLVQLLAVLDAESVSLDMLIRGMHRFLQTRPKSPPMSPYQNQTTTMQPEPPTTAGSSTSHHRPVKGRKLFSRMRRSVSYQESEIPDFKSFNQPRIQEFQFVDGDTLATSMQNPELTKAILSTLNDRSLVRSEVSTQDHAIYMHELTQYICNNLLLDLESGKRWARFALQILEARMREIGDVEAPQNSAYVNAVIVQVLHLEQKEIVYNLRTVNAYCYLLHKTGVYFRSLGEYNEARRLLTKALELAETLLGANDLATVHCLRDLAEVFNKSDFPLEAERLHKRELEGLESLLGPDHLETIRCVYSIALVCTALERPEEALPFNQRALRGFEATLGPNHLTTIECVDNLATLYSLSFQDRKAEPLHERAVKGFTLHLGPTHPSTVQSLEDLANHYSFIGRVDEAEKAYMRVLKAREDVFGPDDPKTLGSVGVLAKFYDLAGKADKAGPCYERACLGLEQRLGPGDQSARRARGEWERFLDRGRRGEHVHPHAHLQGLGLLGP
jgi:tetratricopeptide (TPR) repeat protein